MEFELKNITSKIFKNSNNPTNSTIFKIDGRTDGLLLFDNKSINCNRKSSNDVPYQGFLIKVPKSKVICKLVYSHPPKKPKKMAKNYNPVALINGSFWNGEKQPLNWFIIDNREITPLTNNNMPCVAFFEDDLIVIDFPPEINSMISAKKNENSKSIIDVLQAGPLLIMNHAVNLDYSEFTLHKEEYDSDITIHRHPRAFMGYDNDYFYLFSINGRSLKSAGLYLEECAFICKKLGLSHAINLDGGASSTLMANEKMLNQSRFSFIPNSRVFSMALPTKQRTQPSCILFLER